MQEHGPWRILNSREVYRDPWLALRRDEVVRPDGNPGTYSVVNLKPGVCVLALEENDDVYLTEEFHYAVGRVTVEAVSGGVEPGELPDATARRELKEEIGIDAEEWTDFGPLDPFTGSVCSPTRLYLARRLVHGAVAMEGTETIRKVRMPLNDAVRMAMTGDITHAPTVAVLLKTRLWKDQVDDRILMERK